MTTWETAPSGAGVVFSNGDLTATTDAAEGVITTVRSTEFKNSGKVFLEVTGSALTADFALGLVNESFALDEVLLGTEFNGIGYFPKAGDRPSQSIWLGRKIASIGTIEDVNGAVFTLAVDFDTFRLWIQSPAMRASNARWNNSVAADPETGVGGISFAEITGPFAIAFQSRGTGSVASLNVGASPYTQSLPAGFTSWDIPFAVSQLTTWDPNNLHGGIVLSNSNYTATSLSAVVANGGETVFSTTSKSTGKLVFEIVMDALVPDWTVGLASGGFPLWGEILGATETGIGFRPQGPPQATFLGSSRINGGVAPSITGETASFATNLDTKAWWVSTPTMRADGRPWNNSRTASPDTGVGGVSFSSITAPFHIVFNSDQVGAAATINTLPPFSIRLPMGYGPWDGGSVARPTLTGVEASPGVTAPTVEIVNPGRPIALIGVAADPGVTALTVEGTDSSAVTVDIQGVSAPDDPSESLFALGTPLAQLLAGDGGEVIDPSFAVSAAPPGPLSVVIGSATIPSNYRKDALFFCVDIETYRPGAIELVYAYGIGSRPVGAIELFATPLVDSGHVLASDLGYRSREDDADGLVVYPPTLNSAFQINRKVNLDPTVTQNAVASAWGYVMIANPTGALDDISRVWNSDGRSVRIFWGNKLYDPTRGYLVDPPFASLRMAFAGTAQPWSLSEGSLKVPLRDAGYFLERRLQKRQYGGSGGYDGTASLAGTDMPMVRGGRHVLTAGQTPLPVPNVPVVQVDQAKLIYQWTDGPGALAAVYEGAAENYGFHSDTTNLYAGSTPASMYRTDVSRGLFQLGTKPTNTITVDCYGDFPLGGQRWRLIEIVQYLLTEELNMPASSLDLASFAVADSLYPYPAGVVFDPSEGVSGVTAIDRVLASIYGRLVMLRDGRLRIMVPRVASVGVPTSATLDTTNIVEVRPDDLPPNLDPPPYRLRVGYQRSWTVQTSGLLGSATEDRKSFVGKSERYATWISNTIQQAYRRPQDPNPISTSLLAIGDAQTVANDIGALWGTSQRKYLVTLPAEIALALELGDYVNITYPISDLAQGQVAQIIEDTLDSETATVTYGLIGLHSRTVALPGQVRNVRVVRVTEGSLDITWYPVTGENVRYQVLFAAGAPSVPPPTSLTSYTPFGSPTTNESVTIIGLTPGTLYDIIVHALTDAGPGPLSVPIQGQTSGATPPVTTTPGQVFGVTVLSVTATTVTVAWTAPPTGGMATGYLLEYQATTGLWHPSGTVAGSPATISGLLANTAYLIRVTAVNDVGPGTPSSSVPARTSSVGTGVVAPGQTQSVAVPSVTTTTATVSWSPPATGGIPVDYVVEYRLTGGSLWTGAVVASASPTTISGLQAATPYEFRVTARNGGGSGTPSAVVGRTTQSVAVGTTTWNPSDKSAQITLSSGNLTATNSSGVSVVRATTGQTTGKYHFEATITGAGTGWALGLATSGAALTAALGTSTASVGVFPLNADAVNVTANGIVLGSGTYPGVAGDRVGIDVDLGARLMWVASTAMRAAAPTRAYNNSTSADPATGIGGISLSQLASGSLFIAFSASGAGASATLDVGATAFAFQVPSGYVGWDTTPSASVPGQVANLTSTTITQNSIGLTWSQPIGSPTSYTVQYKLSSAGGFTNTLVSSVTSATVTGLTATTSYDFRVFASNGTGAGLASIVLTRSTTAVVQLPGTPGTPTSTAITASSVTLAWTAPATGGAPTSYIARYRLVGATVYTDGPSTASLTVNVPNLSSGTTYQFVVAAINGAGTGANSGILSATTTVASTTRLWQDQPGSDVSYWNTPLKTGATWSALSHAMTVDARQAGVVNAGQNGTTIVISSASDPLITVHASNATNPSFTGWAAHIPVGTRSSPPYPGTNLIAVFDLSHPYQIFSMSGGLTDGHAITGAGSETIRDGQVDDAAGTMEDVETDQWGENRGVGVIRLWELNPATNPTMRLQHTLSVTLANNRLLPPLDSEDTTTIPGSNEGLPYICWPARLSDPGGPADYSGHVPFGATLGIPSNVAMPGSLTQGGQMLWWNAQNYGWMVTGGYGSGGPSPIAETSAEGHARLTEMRQDLAIINANLRVLTNQSGVSTRKGTGTLLVSGPPPLAGVSSKSIRINQPSNVILNTPFTVSGYLTGYVSAVSLQYADDSASAVSMPGSVASPYTSFSFTHPGMVGGTHTVTVRDAALTTVNGSAMFLVGAGSTESADRTVILAGSTAVITDASANRWSITTGSQVAVNGVVDTTTGSVARIAYVTQQVWMGNASGLWWYKNAPTDAWLPPQGTTESPLISPDRTVITPGNGVIHDANNFAWTVTPGGQVAVNGVADTGTSRVTTMAYVSGQIWQENADNLWWYKNVPSDFWRPEFGTPISPLADVGSSLLLSRGPFHTSGSQIVDARNAPQRIASVGWTGGNTEFPLLDGLWAVPWRETMDDMVRLGFNCVRLLTCTRATVTNADYVTVDVYNDDLIGLKYLEVYDMLIDYADTIGLRVIVDCHNQSENSGQGQNTNGLWYGIEGVTDADHVNAWIILATRWKDKAAILGYDIINEPLAWACNWDPGSQNASVNLRYMYERVGNAILAIDPKPLIICAGPFTFGPDLNLAGTGVACPGGDLSLAQSLPVVLNVPNKVVYTVHSYPSTVSGEPPEPEQDMFDRFTPGWGYLVRDRIAPVWVGECGTRLITNPQSETSWAASFVAYCNGQAPGGPTFTGTEEGVGTDWWQWHTSTEPNAPPLGFPDFGVLTSWRNGSIQLQQKPYIDALKPRGATVPGPSAPLVSAPLTGAVSAGAWQSLSIPMSGLPSGQDFRFGLLLPHNYSTSVSYPIIVYEHSNLEGNQCYETGANLFNINLGRFSMWNTVAFRTRYPAIILMPYCDQTDGSGGLNYNFGGYNDSPGNSVNANAVVEMIRWAWDNISCYKAKTFITGDALGALGTVAMMLDFNQINGPMGRVFTAGLSLAGGISRSPNPLADPAEVIRMRNVPLYMVSGKLSFPGGVDPYDFEQPQWRNYAGNSNYPTAFPGAVAGNSKFWVFESPNLGYNIWGGNPGEPEYNGPGLNYRMQFDGQAFYDWLYAQQTSGFLG